MAFQHLFTALFRRRRLEVEMAEEMALHRELEAQRLRAAGVPAPEAARAAARAFGHVDRITEAARDAQRWRGGEELLKDLGYTFRVLQKHPGFTVASVLTLALGIGFVTTLYTMINGVAFGRLPFPAQERIVSVDLPAAQFDEVARRQQACEVLSFAQPVEVNLRSGDAVSRHPAAYVSADFLPVLRAQVWKGRGFLPEDEQPGAPRVALVSQAVWERELGGGELRASDVLVNRERYAVVGVLPEGFGFPFHQEIWMVRRTDEPVPGGFIFGRLAAGVSRRQASAQFTAIREELRASGAPAGDFVWDADRSADPSAGRRAVEVVPFAERGVKDALRLMLSAVLAATFLVLLLACANVAQLGLARAVDRRKEMAMRAALGATRGRLIRQMLTENVVLAVLGAAGGILITLWSSQAIWNYMMRERPLTGGAPFWINFDLDGRVFAFAAGVTVLTAMATGLVPAWRASRVSLNEALKDGAGSGLRVSGWSRFLINLQLAFSMCLVTVAGLFVTVLITFNHKVLPYDPHSILTARISLEEAAYANEVETRHFYETLLERLAARPEIVAAGLTSAESLRRTAQPRVEIEGHVYPSDGDRPNCVLESVSPGFLDAYGVGIRSGRRLEPSDSGAADPVALVNVAFAERFAEGRDVVGRRLRFPGTDSDAPWITIVGVVPDLGSVKAGERSRGPIVYRPFAQQGGRAMTVLLRGRAEVQGLGGVLRREVAALDPDVPVARLQSVQEIIELERIGMNAFGVLFVACGVGALVLASVGIYGVISLGVRLRTREFGVRMALGASREMILRLVLREGVRRLAGGLVVGALLAVAASTGLNATFLGFGRSSLDVWVYGGVALLLAAVSGSALLLPARRAARADPLVALRNE